MKLKMITSHPIAVGSMDYIDGQNSGSQNDNSRNPHFNKKLYELFGGKIPSVLDLGCAGGGFVNSVIKDGGFAAGIDGNDFCQKTKKFEWANIPDNLFTCDLTKPFQLVYRKDCPVLFDVITAWEVMEHIKEEDLPQFIENVKLHLKKGGLFICSVSKQVDRHFHVTVKNESFWIPLFKKYGLEHREELKNKFGGHWVRGPQRTEWAADAADSFHLVLQGAESIPAEKNVEQEKFEKLLNKESNEINTNASLAKSPSPKLTMRANFNIQNAKR